MEIRRRNRWLCLSFGHKRVYAQIGLCSFLFSKKVRNTAPRGPCRWQTPPAMHVSDYKGSSERVISLSLGMKVTLLVTHYTLRPRSEHGCAHTPAATAPPGAQPRRLAAATRATPVPSSPVEWMPPVYRRGDPAAPPQRWMHPARPPANRIRPRMRSPRPRQSP